MASELDEFELIERYFAPLSKAEPGAFGLTDDAALLTLSPGMSAVVTTDVIIAGVHFPVSENAQAIASRLVRVNLSDIAAMGARPRAYTVSLGLPDGTTEAWIAAFAAGLADEQNRFDITLVGGDTTHSAGALMLSLTMVGETAEKNVITRSGAAAGDDVYVSGTIGDAALGLALLEGRLETADAADRAELIGRFRTPLPRVDVGLRLAGLASAAADVSDGLVADLNHICQASRASAEIEMARIPLSAAAKRLVTDDQPLRTSLLSGGDDYELVFTAAGDAAESIRQVAADCGVALTRIGCIVGRAGQPDGVTVHDAAGRSVEIGDGGYRHFRKHDRESR